MRIEMKRIVETSQMAIRLTAENFTEVLLMGRWQGHIEAAGGHATSQIIETTLGNTAQIPQAAVTLTMPIANKPPDDNPPDEYHDTYPTPGEAL